MSATRPAIGSTVMCPACGRQKKPIGRDASAARSDMCTLYSCDSYDKEPFPQDLWPGERRDGGTDDD